MSPPKLIIVLSLALVFAAWAFTLCQLIDAYQRSWVSEWHRRQALSWLWPMAAFGPLVLAMLALAAWATP